MNRKERRRDPQKRGFVRAHHNSGYRDGQSAATDVYLAEEGVKLVPPGH